LALYFAGGQVRGSSATRHQVLEHMAALFLEDADSETIQVVQAACLVRTATAPLLAAMLPHISAAEALDRLRALPFVSVGPHGLLVHEAVRGPVTAALKSRDPARYQAYRQRDPTFGVARRTYSTCLKTKTYAKVFSPQRRARFPSNQLAPTTGHQFQRLFATSMDRSRVKRSSNGGTTIHTRFLSCGMNMAECKVSTRQLSHRRFTKM
jgi:hypothetical protein